MQIGYARVSRGDSQDLDPQLRALTDAGCSIIYQEEASGAKSDRPELALAIGALKPGDVLTVWKLDRLSRSLRDLLFTLEAITEAEAGFRSLTEAIDTTTPAGRLMTQTLGAFAEFERAMIRERTMNGLAHARKAGKHIASAPSPFSSVPRSSSASRTGKAPPPSSPRCSACRDRPCSGCCGNIGQKKPRRWQAEFSSLAEQSAQYLR